MIHAHCPNIEKEHTSALDLGSKPLRGAVVEETLGHRESLGVVPVLALVVERVVHFVPRLGLGGVVYRVGDTRRVRAVYCVNIKMFCSYIVVVVGQMI